MKARLILLAFLIVLPFTGRAQDDDMYFTPSKSSKSSAKTHRIQPVYTPVEDEDEDYEYYTGDLRDIDEYNRRPHIAEDEDKQAVVLDTLGMKWVLSRTDMGDYVWIPAEDYERIQEQADEYFDDIDDFEDYDGYDDDDYNYSSRLVRFHGYVSPYHFGWYDPWYYDYYWWDPWYSWYWRPWYWGYGWGWGLGWYGWGGWYGWHHGWHGGWHGGYAYGRRGTAFGHTRGGALAYGRGRYSGSNLARGNERVSTGNRTTLGDRMSARRNATSSTRGSGMGSRIGGTSGTRSGGSFGGSSRGSFSGGGDSFGGGARGGFSGGGGGFGGGARGGGGGGRR